MKYVPVGTGGLLRFGHITALTAARGLSFTTVMPLRYLDCPKKQRAKAKSWFGVQTLRYD